MAKNMKYIKPTVIVCEPYTAEQQETRFRKEYGFNKPVSVRSPVSGWEDKYIRSGDASAPPKEIAMVKGSPSKFSHRRDGNSYGSRPTRRNIRRGK